ncbi:acyltransferase [Arenibacter sp. F26102]|uniref:acyltransferase n=1 Tax=Arenibacter sp. F26102 TaxID=2926416 RepID=UPI001FF56D33|nr:acyltransferase [Arenibacter sp. F26102]MCK0147047.1 acyltransferase [Arenibacter sp. F26102]
MSRLLASLKHRILLWFINTPIFNRYSQKWYEALGVVGSKYRISPNITLVGSYSNLKLGQRSEINAGCFLLAKDRIVIGENSTLAYQTTILTSANPNGPHNVLVRLYPAIKKPVIIGKNSWIGARATILPGVTIGNYCIVAAGALVTKDVPDYTLVAGVPAREIKQLDKTLLR